VATGDVEWPTDPPTARYPHGVVHHYAPLAFITVADGGPTVNRLMRKTITVVAHDMISLVLEKP
jgi:hypothetical protein